MTGDRWPLSRLFNWREQAVARPSFVRAFESNNRLEPRKSSRKIQHSNSPNFQSDYQIFSRFQNLLIIDVFEFLFSVFALYIERKCLYERMYTVARSYRVGIIYLKVEVIF